MMGVFHINEATLKKQKRTNKHKKQIGQDDGRRGQYVMAGQSHKGGGKQHPKSQSTCADL